MKYQLVKQIKDNDVLRESFIALAMKYLIDHFKTGMTTAFNKIMFPSLSHA